MEIERLPDRGEEKKPEQSGQWLWRHLKPFGCILCLGIMVLALIVCFTAGRDPIPGYEAPADSSHYAQHLAELEAELEANVLPHLEGIVSCEISGDKLLITIEEHSFAASRGAVLQYFDIELFEFVMEE